MFIPRCTFKFHIILLTHTNKMITLKHKTTGQFKRIPTGFSFTLLFFGIFVPLISFVLISVIERPVLQVFHYIFMPYFSHDYLLKWHYNLKNGLNEEEEKEIDTK